MTTLIFFFASVFRDWRQRHVAPPQWPGLWVHIPDTAHWALSWPWVMAPTLGAHCAVINTDPAPGTGSCPSGKTSQHIYYIYYGEIEIAFLISPSGKCLWSLQLSWLNLFLRIFAGISKLHRRRNLFSFLAALNHSSGEMLAAPGLISWLLLQCETHSLSPNVTNCPPLLSNKTVKVCDYNLSQEACILSF